MWRWQLDLIDYQRFSTKDVDAVIETLENEAKRLNTMIEEQKKINPNTIDKSVFSNHYTVLKNLSMKKAERQQLIDSGQQSEYRFIFSMKDHFTRYCFLRPLRSKDMDEVLYHVNEIFMMFHYPRILQTDNGKEFRNEKLEVIYYLFFYCLSFYLFIYFFYLNYHCLYGYMLFVDIVQRAWYFDETWSTAQISNARFG
jgi:hypothetical protein